MSPAAWPRAEPLEERLLVVDVDALAFQDARVRDLPWLLREGDVLVVNDAATVPASLRARLDDGRRLEVRLLARTTDDRTWRAVLFDEHDWRSRTEDRATPPVLAVQQRLVFEEGPSLTPWSHTAGSYELEAEIRAVDALSPRLVTLRFDRDGAALWSALYRMGRPVQYAHVASPLALWATQTPYASRPWAVEQPSAGRPLVARVLAGLRERGVDVAWLTHAAGLSATGDAVLDAALPLPERFDIPEATVAAVAKAKARRGRVVAAGTTVVRALEGGAALRGGALAAGEGTTDLRVGPSHRLRVVDALLTGLHEPGTSHFELLQAFAPRELLERAYAHAEQAGYVGHEFGDSSLIARSGPRS